MKRQPIPWDRCLDCHDHLVGPPRFLVDVIDKPDPEYVRVPVNAAARIFVLPEMTVYHLNDRLWGAGDIRDRIRLTDVPLVCGRCLCKRLLQVPIKSLKSAKGSLLHPTLQDAWFILLVGASLLQKVVPNWVDGSFEAKILDVCVAVMTEAETIDRRETDLMHHEMLPVLNKVRVANPRKYDELNSKFLQGMRLTNELVWHYFTVLRKRSPRASRASIVREVARALYIHARPHPPQPKDRKEWLGKFAEALDTRIKRIEHKKNRDK